MAGLSIVLPTIVSCWICTSEHSGLASVRLSHMTWANAPWQGFLAMCLQDSSSIHTWCSPQMSEMLMPSKHDQVCVRPDSGVTHSSKGLTLPAGWTHQRMGQAALARPAGKPAGEAGTLSEYMQMMLHVGSQCAVHVLASVKWQKIQV